MSYLSLLRATNNKLFENVWKPTVISYKKVVDLFMKEMNEQSKIPKIIILSDDNQV